MTTVAIYACTNTPEEATVEDQLDLCRSYAAERGWTVTRVYTETAAFGRASRRLELQTMIEDAEAKAFDIALVAAVDRLGRQLKDPLKIAAALASAAVELHSASDGQDLQLESLLVCSEDTAGKVNAATRRRRRAARLEHRLPATAAACATSATGREAP